MGKRKAEPKIEEKKRTYTVRGPYGVKCIEGKRGRVIDENEAKKDFAEKAGDYKNRIGVYVFGVLRTGGSVPWYVGRTANKFIDEVFTPQNVRTYNKALIHPGKPVVFLIVHPKLGRGRGVPAVKQIGEIEDFFVKLCYEKNKDLLNKQLIPRVTRWGVKGIIGTRGRADESAGKLRKMVGLATNK